MSEVLDLDADDNVVLKKGDKKIKIRFPSVDEQFELDDELKTADKDDIRSLYAIQKKFIMKLGAPKEILDQLSSRQFFALVEAIQGKKK